MCETATDGVQGAQTTYTCCTLGREWRTADKPGEVEKRWHYHFTKILNIPSEYHSDVIDKMRRLHHEELDHPPTLDKLLIALVRLKKGKVAWGEERNPTC